MYARQFCSVPAATAIFPTCQYLLLSSFHFLTTRIPSNMALFLSFRLWIWTYFAPFKMRTSSCKQHSSSRSQRSDSEVGIRMMMVKILPIFCVLWRFQPNLVKLDKFLQKMGQVRNPDKFSKIWGGQAQSGQKDETSVRTKGAFPGTGLTRTPDIPPKCRCQKSPVFGFFVRNQISIFCPKRQRHNFFSKNLSGKWQRP